MIFSAKTELTIPLFIITVMARQSLPWPFSTKEMMLLTPSMRNILRKGLILNFLRRKEEDGKVGEFVNGIRDKHVWVKWMELRVHGEAAAVKAPTGYIPCFEDLERLFKEVLGKTYTRANYIEQFTIRIPENLAKLERVKAFHHQKVADAPPELFQILAEQEERLRAAEKTFGSYPSPECFPVEQ